MLRDDWTTREVKELISEDFDVEITENGVYRMLRSWKMKLGKPYEEDYRRPDNAEELLKKRLKKPSGSRKRMGSHLIS